MYTVLIIGVTCGIVGFLIKGDLMSRFLVSFMAIALGALLIGLPVAFFLESVIEYDWTLQETGDLISFSDGLFVYEKVYGESEEKLFFITKDNEGGFSSQTLQMRKGRIEYSMYTRNKTFYYEKFITNPIRFGEWVMPNSFTHYNFYVK